MTPVMQIELSTNHFLYKHYNTHIDITHMGIDFNFDSLLGQDVRKDTNMPLAIVEYPGGAIDTIWEPKDVLGNSHYPNGTVIHQETITPDTRKVFVRMSDADELIWNVGTITKNHDHICRLVREHVNVNQILNRALQVKGAFLSNELGTFGTFGKVITRSGNTIEFRTLDGLVKNHQGNEPTVTRATHSEEEIRNLILSKDSVEITIYKVNVSNTETLTWTRVDNDTWYFVSHKG